MIVGILVGTLFWQTDSSASKVSVLFQSMFYACTAQMVAIGRQFSDRSIFYKHQDANFFPTYAYVFGKSVASIPIAITGTFCQVDWRPLYSFVAANKITFQLSIFKDAICYGTAVYFLVGLSYNDGASVANYFIFLLLVFTASLTTGLFFMIYSASVRVVTTARACIALATVVFLVVCGFTVQPGEHPRRPLLLVVLGDFYSLTPLPSLDQT